MTQDEIIEMVKKAGWSGIYSSWTSPTNRTSLTVPVTMQQIEAFANLVAAKEREALAQRTWVGLTDEEIAQGCKESWVTEQAWQSAVWWAEAKLKQKNHVAQETNS
jgi:hypothetical protein